MTNEQKDRLIVAINNHAAGKEKISAILEFVRIREDDAYIQGYNDHLLTTKMTLKKVRKTLLSLERKVTK